MESQKLAYSVLETSRLLGVSRAWLYHRWAIGDGPPRCKVGSRTLVPAENLRQWLSEQRGAKNGS